MGLFESINLSKIFFLFTIFLLSFLLEKNLMAEDYFYLRNVDNCIVKIWKNGSWQNTSVNKLVHRPLKINQFSTDPHFINFVEYDQRYLASTECLFEATAGHPEIKNNKEKIQYVDEIMLANTPFKSSDEYNKIFLSLDGGFSNLIDSSKSIVNYNSMIKYDPSNPITWSSESKSNYQIKSSWGLGLGIQKFENIFISFRLKSFSGNKTDTVSALNLNNNFTITGEWYLSEVITNYYLGFKQNIPTNSAFIPTYALFIGLSSGDTIISDGTSNYTFKSMGLGALIDLGLEYKINPTFRLGVNFEYEYLGKKRLRTSDESGLISNVETSMKYSNLNAILGLKSYF